MKIHIRTNFLSVYYILRDIELLVASGCNNHLPKVSGKPDRDTESHVRMINTSELQHCGVHNYRARTAKSIGSSI